jgi:hypothetical protein
MMRSSDDSELDLALKMKSMCGMALSAPVRIIALSLLAMIQAINDSSASRVPRYYRKMAFQSQTDGKRPVVRCADLRCPEVRFWRLPRLLAERYLCATKVPLSLLTSGLRNVFA